MEIEFDPAKRLKNRTNHGVDFGAAEFFEWEDAVIVEDRRFDYGETRMVATGYIGSRLHVLVFSIPVKLVRVISLRKANSREMKRYAET